MNEYEYRRHTDRNVREGDARRRNVRQGNVQQRTARQGDARRSDVRRSDVQRRDARRRDMQQREAHQRRNREVEECLALERESEQEYREYLERKKRRQQRRRQEELRRRRILKLRIQIAGALLLGILIFIPVYKLFFSNPVKKEITVEAGTKNLKPEDFLKKKKVKAEFVTDMSKIAMNHVGKQEIVLKARGKERKCQMTVKDTKAPKAEAVPATINLDGNLKAKELVKNIKDSTDVKCSFQEEPDLSKEGTVPVTVVLTDEGGNKGEVTVKVRVMKDEEPPVIDGVAPLTAFVGDPISYKSEIKVTDNCDKNVKLEVDNSDVDTEKEGTYDVIYRASDRAGNEAEEKTTITLKKKPENYVEPDKVNEEADAVLNEILTEDMSTKEKAKAIYNWVRKNIRYVNTSEKDSWTNGAYQGFTERKGDCFIYFATAKALLTQAGIPNLDVVKSDTSQSRHYWSLVDCGDGWYHYDTTPRQSGGDFFMKTDEEILKFSKAHKNSHIFDQSLYPPTPKTPFTMD